MLLAIDEFKVKLFTLFQFVINIFTKYKQIRIKTMEFDQNVFSKFITSRFNPKHSDMYCILTGVYAIGYVLIIRLDYNSL